MSTNKVHKRQINGIITGDEILLPDDDNNNESIPALLHIDTGLIVEVCEFDDLDKNDSISPSLLSFCSSEI